MLYSKVLNNSVVSEKPFTLPLNYQDEDGNIHANIEKLPLLEKLALGLFPTEEDVKPEFDSLYSELQFHYTINADSVSLTHSIVPVKVTEIILEQRLIRFGKEKGIDMTEVPLLLNSPDPVWRNEAQHFQELYLASWQAFYNNSVLPDLVW